MEALLTIHKSRAQRHLSWPKDRRRARLGPMPRPCRLQYRIAETLGTNITTEKVPENMVISIWIVHPSSKQRSMPNMPKDWRKCASCP